MSVRATLLLGVTAWTFLWPGYLFSRDRKMSLTVKDSIETWQFLYPYGGRPVLISPDDKRYLVVLERGDVKRNGSWVELLSGSTDSVDAARKANIIARLFSKSTASAGDLIKNVRWLNDSQHVTFLWDDGESPRKIVSVDVKNRQIKTLCQHPTPIVDYDISQNGRTIIFMAQAKHNVSDEASLERRGFAITDQSIRSILEGDFDGWTPHLHYDTFVQYGPKGLLYKIHEPQRTWYTPPELLRLSPDGRYAITVRPASTVPAEWDRYTEYLFKDIYLPVARQNPAGANLIREYFLVDVSSRTVRPLWNAPENPVGKILWSPDSRSLIIGPTFLPVPSANAVGLSGQAVAEVDASARGFVTIPLPRNSRESQYGPARWVEDGVLELAAAAAQGPGSLRLRFKKFQGAWTQIEEEGLEEDLGPEVRVDILENPNTPPALYAVDSRDGSRDLILDPNPQLKDFTLGHVELVHWTATDGRPWTGMLYYPVHYRAGQAKLSRL